MSELFSDKNEKRLPDLPQGWVWATLEESMKKVSDGAHFTPHYVDAGYPFIKISDVNGDEIDFSNVQYVDEQAYEYLKKNCNPQKGDVLFSKDGTVGKVIEINYDKQFVVLSSLAIIRPHQNLTTSPYLKYLMQSSFIQNQATKSKTGTAISRIIVRNIKPIKIPISPLNEQHRIVTKIEELLTQLDAGVASLKKVQAQLKRYRHAVLKTAFEGRLTQEWREEHKGEIEPADVLRDKIVESQQKWIKGKSKNIDNDDPEQFAKIPEEWIWTRIHNIAPVIQYGSSEKADDDTTGIPIIRMGNLQYGKIDFSNLKYISKKSPGVAKCLLHCGDVLFNRTNSAELVGKTAVFNKESFEAVFASYLIRMRVDDDLYSPEFLSYYINSAFGRSYISSVVSQQVGQANVNGTKLANLPIPFPHISEQKNIVSEIERHFSQIDHLENTITTSLRQAETLHQSILKRAFEGKLVPQDPNDEPASILLERIKAEKARYAVEVKKGKTLQPKSPKRKIKNGN